MVPYGGYPTSVRKTSVYLTDDEAEGLRALAAASGRSQADLIREGIRRVLSRKPRRVFHSMGIIASGEPRSARWDAEELAARRGVGRSTPTRS